MQNLPGSLPYLDNSTFILKTTVMSTNQGKGIRGNALIGGQNALIEDENALIGEENALIGEANAWILSKNAWIGHAANLHKNGMMTAVTSSDIIAILEDMRENQVVGTQDIQKILDCKKLKPVNSVHRAKYLCLCLKLWKKSAFIV